MKIRGVFFLIVFVFALITALLCVVAPAHAEYVNLATQLPAVAAVNQTPEEPPPIDGGTTVVEKLLDLFNSADTKYMLLYSFKNKQASLAAMKDFPIIGLTPTCMINAQGMLLSADGLSFGLGIGASFMKITQSLDATIGWTPQQGLVIGGWINY